MKILTIATCFDRHEDDCITPWLTEALKHVQALGHDVEVLASSYKGLGDQTVHGLSVRRFRYFPARWEMLTHEETAPDRVRRNPIYLLMVFFYVLSGMWKAFRLARRNRYDIIHVHWPLPHALMGYAAKLGCRGRLVCTFHGVEVTWVNARMRFLKPYLRWVLRVSDAITVNSSFTQAQVRTIGRSEPFIVPFGAGLPGELPAGEDGAARHDHPRDILFIGRLVERKGVRFLLEALPHVRMKIPDVRATVVGDGPLRAELESQARELDVAGIVTFTGVVSTTDLRRLFERTDLFVLPAVVDAMGCTEGLGVVIIEAMSYGKPVVASDVGGIPDVVKHGETGLLVPPGNPSELASAITAVLDDADYAARLGARGRRRASEAFSWGAIARRIEDLYRSLL